MLMALVYAKVQIESGLVCYCDYDYISLATTT